MKKVLLFLVAAVLCAGAVNAASPEPTLKKGERCEPATGSRLSRAPNAQGICEHDAAVTRSYSQEEIERTGQIDLDVALSRLDPALAARGGFAGGTR